MAPANTMAKHPASIGLQDRSVHRTRLVQYQELFRRVGFREGEAPPDLTAEDWAEIMEQHQMRSPE